MPTFKIKAFNYVTQTQQVLCHLLKKWAKLIHRVRITFSFKGLTFLRISGILYVLKVRDTTQETKKMNNKLNNWTSHNELNAEPCKARIHRLQRHNAILNIGLAVMIPAIVVLFFATLVIACA